MSKDNQGAIFIASFSEQLIREKVMMDEPSDNWPRGDEAVWDHNTVLEMKLAMRRYREHVASRRTFSYDVKEEQDGQPIPESEFRLRHQFRGNEEWKDCAKETYNASDETLRRIIAIPIEPDNIGETDYEKYDLAWTDELVKELLWSRFPFPESVTAIQPILNQFKKDKNIIDEKHSPIEPDTPLQPVKDEGFEDYIRNARDEFVIAICDNTYNTAIRTAAESILIAYDQMRDKLSSPPEPSSKEQEGDQNKHWKEVTEIILKDYAAFKHQQSDKPTSPDELKQKFIIKIKP